MSNVFEVIKMNGPTPLEVMNNCFDAIDCIDDIEDELDQNDIVCLVEYKHYEFTLNNGIHFVVRYNDDEERTELEIIAPVEQWRKRVEHFKKYPQYADKTDDEIWPQKYLITEMLDEVGHISMGYEDICSNLTI